MYFKCALEELVCFLYVPWFVRTYKTSLIEINDRENKSKNVKCSTSTYKLFCHFWHWKLILFRRNIGRCFGDFKFKRKIRIKINRLVSCKVRKRFFLNHVFSWLWLWTCYSVVQNHLTLHKKRSFPLRIFSVNVTKSAENCRFGHIYWRNPLWKTSFFCAVLVSR